jgi:hypothetical protein
MSTKKANGQFYTTKCAYILDGMPLPPADVRCIIEPFAGNGDLISWLRDKNVSTPIESYDIDPKRDDIQKRDTLRSPPNYTDAWVLTNPPYLARNKSDSKELFDMYDTNDLYKCFIHSICKTPCRGGVILIPAGFFFSSRDLDTRCRATFMQTYTLTKVKYFEETVFDDTTTTIVAIAFVLSDHEADKQVVEWTFLPSNETKTFEMTAVDKWIIGGSIYSMESPVVLRRHVEGDALRNGEYQTFMTLNALDSGTAQGRIKITYKKDYVYPAKDSSRTYATFRIMGIDLQESEQQQLCEMFNAFLEEKRLETRSLFLPQYRESKEYARKRIPFDLAYRILGCLVHRMKAAP